MTLEPETRHSLLARLRGSRDEAAWREFIAIYQPLIMRLARREGLQHADAEELAQQVLVAVAGAIERFDPDAAKGSFRAWLHRIAKNLIVNYWVRRKRHPPGAGGSDVQWLLEEQPAAGDESALFETEYRRQVLRFATEQVRGEFRPDSWRAFWLTCVEGRPIAEVAAELGQSVGAVYTHRSRVVARLRERVRQIESESH